MTTKQAIETWKTWRVSVSVSELDNKAKHDLLHEVFAAINRARIAGELTPAQIEAL